MALFLVSLSFINKQTGSEILDYLSAQILYNYYLWNYLH